MESKRRKQLFAEMGEAFKLVLLVKPLSAAAECVFSLLNNSFNTRQESAIEDYIHLSVMMQYNDRKSK